MKSQQKSKLLLILLIFSFNCFLQFAQNSQINRNENPVFDRSPLASQSFVTSIPVLSSGFVYWHRNDGYVVQSTDNNQTKIGHDFDYWNEAWRGWYTLDVSGFNSSTQILSVQLKFRIVGKPDEANSARAQLGFYYQEQNPLIYEMKEDLYNRFNSGTQLRNGGYFSVSEITSFPTETDYIDLGTLGAKIFERNIQKGVFSFSILDQFEGAEKEEYDEGLILELIDVLIEYVPNGKILNVKSLNSPDSVSFNSILEITWNSSYIVQNITIILYKNGLLLTIIVTNIPNENSHNWSVPDTLDPLSKYMIAVQDSTNSSLFGVSEEFSTGKQPYSPTIQDFIFISIAIIAVIAVFFGIYIFGKKQKIIQESMNNEYRDTQNPTKTKPKKPASKKPIICSYCGTENDPESLECRYCGKEFE